MKELLFVILMYVLSFFHICNWEDCTHNFELKSEKHSFANQVASDSQYLNYKPYTDLEWFCIRRLLNTFQANGFIEKDSSVAVLKIKSFSIGNFEPFYKEVFKRIKDNK